MVETEVVSNRAEGCLYEFNVFWHGTTRMTLRSLCCSSVSLLSLCRTCEALALVNGLVSPICILGLLGMLVTCFVQKVASDFFFLSL